MKREPIEHLLLFRHTLPHDDLSPEELQRALDATMAWFERLEAAGQLVAAKPLFDEGAMISRDTSGAITDGPYAETKESVAGYLILPPCEFDEAVAIAKTWPMLDHGGRVEIRPIAPECPSFQRLREMTAHAHA